jgi:hypothetical protein
MWYVDAYQTVRWRGKGYDAAMRSVLALFTLLAACGGSSEPRGAREPAPAASATAPASEEASASGNAKAAGPWGASVASADDDERATTWLKGLEAGNATPPKLIVVGPGLWFLFSQDPDLAKLGIPVTVIAKINGKEQQVRGRAIRNDEVATALAHPLFVEMGKYFGAGAVAAASEEERQIYYEEIPWEIAGQAISVARVGDERLLLHFRDDTLSIELLEAWLLLTRPPPTQP